ncbi:hypothetical protein [Kordiimonas gwangyangensis]|uniref:hypothetical protein n=1 Tax=Kordiimonas gwangyangensis TaxID=288022 RepID=UPI0034E30171
MMAAMRVIRMVEFPFPKTAQTPHRSRTKPRIFCTVSAHIPHTFRTGFAHIGASSAAFALPDPENIIFCRNVQKIREFFKNSHLFFACL